MTPRLVAIVPAAGLSRRMGQPKLLLDLGGQTVIARVLQALRNAGINQCMVVVRSADSALIREVTLEGGEVVLPDSDPADMRQSVEWGLRAAQGGGRAAWDGWVLVPADHPTMNHSTIRILIEAWSRNRSQIAVPCCEGQRGHPTVFPWSLADEVYNLPRDHGINGVLRSSPERVLEVNVADSSVLVDLDSPQDLQRLREAWTLNPECPPE